MAFSDTENTAYDSAPVELYRFTGTFRSYYMTPHAVAQSFLAMNYTPTPGLNRGEIELASHNEDQGELEVELPVNHQLVKDYGLQDSPPDLDLIIYRIQRDTGDSMVYFQGKVKEVKITKDTAKLVIPSRFREILRSTLPTIYVQSPCNHVLFDDRCKVNRAANSKETSITAVSGRTITVAATTPFAAGFFTGGEIVIPSTGERRTIVAQSGNAFQVNFEFTRVTPAMNVTLTAGCDHSYTSTNGCPKFANQRNFGGFPFVPGNSNNVFSNGLS